MATAPSFVYPDLHGWNVPGDTDSTDQKPALDFSAPCRPSSTSFDAPHGPAHEAPLPMPAKPKKSRGQRSRKDDVNYVPRPRNCFFIFRCWYARNHAEQARSGDRAPTPEKIVSKRAAAAWKLLPPEEQDEWRLKAKEEAQKHAEMNPNYRYTPRKNHKPRSGSTRRERVESLVQSRESSASRLSDAYSEYAPVDSPVSHTSSSPEPWGPITPRDANFQHHGLAHRRSMSLPHLEAAQLTSPYEYAHTYFIQPESCVSSPGPGPQRTARRSASARQRSYSPSVASIPPPDVAFDLEYGGVTVPFANLAPHASTMSLPELLSLPDLSVDGDWSSTYSTPQMSPAASMHDFGQPEYFSMQPAQPAPSVPLIHRRRRSNTAPSSMLSPLSMVSSSLESYPEGPSAAPALTISPPDRSAAITPTRSMTMPVMASLTGESFDGFGAYRSAASSSSSSLLAPEPDMDIDRTPRRADFPHNVQDVPDVYAHAPPPPPQQQQQQQPQYATATAAAAPPLDFLPVPDDAAPDAYAMEAYSAGLGAFDIAPAPYDVSPFGDLELDFNDFLNLNPPPPFAA